MSRAAVLALLCGPAAAWAPIPRPDAKWRAAPLAAAARSRIPDVSPSSGDACTYSAGARAPALASRLSRRRLLSGSSALASAAALAALPGASVAVAAPYAAPSNNEVYRPAAGSLAGRTVLITGANTGLGLESAKRLLGAGATVVATARTAAKAEQTAAALQSAASDGGGKVVGAVLDLASLASVQSFPGRLEAALGTKDVALDVLLNNAGVMAIPERLSTADGFERTVGVNHLGHFALTAALLPSLKRAKHGFRVVTVSSEAHRFTTTDGISKAVAASLETGGSPEAYSGWGAYGLSKAANVLFTLELQRRLDLAGLRGSAVCLHPGAVQTDLARYITNGVDGGDVRLSEEKDKGAAAKPWEKALQGALDKVVLPVDRGANTQVFLAAGSDAGGDYAQAPAALYFDAMQPKVPNGASRDPALARKLWEASERLTGTTLLGE